MTPLQEAAAKAIEYAEAMCGGRCNAEYNPCHAYEIADCLRTALAQQELPAEPTDDQLVKGVKAMRLFVTKNSVADFKLGYMAALAAAPAPQPAQAWQVLVERFRAACNYIDVLGGDSKGHRQAIESALQSAQPVAQPLTDEQVDAVVVRSCKKDSSHLDAARVARAIEAAHGIREVK